MTFAYGPDRARYRRIDIGTGGTTTTRYIGNVEIIFHPDGTQERKRYIAGVAIESRTVTGGVEGGRSTHYVHKDHLGSVDVLTDASGAVVQELSFDPWGQRRNATDWQALSAGALLGFDHSLTTRGYTGHEMLDEVGLIHMNGRVYDPNLARFLQADPFVQDPTNSQSLNRYSYVWNNPLNATDPSGYFVFSLIAAAIWASAELTVAQIVTMFAFAGFADTLLAGGSFKDALLAGISAGAFAALGVQLGGFTGFGDAVGDVLAMGVLGGVTTVIQGGKFGHGFRSAGLSSLTGGLAGKISQKLQLGKLGQGIARMLAAGTTSELTGGKFANGAAAAAFQSAVTQLGSRDNKYAGKAAEDFEGKVVVEIRYNEISGMPYKHSYVVITDELGNEYYLREGPSVTPEGEMSKQASLLSADAAGSGGGAWGDLVATGGRYLPGTIDYATAPADVQVVHVTDPPVKPVLDKLAGFARAINQAEITYRPLSTNSNAFAHQAPTVLGIERPASVSFAPGSASELEF